MGSCSSKSKTIKRDSKINIPNVMREHGEFIDNSEFSIESIHRDDLMTIERITQDLDENASDFILNNIVMSIQFFRNHKDIIEKLQKDSISQIERDMNKTLIKAETMECILPDVIMDEVNRNVVYKTMNVDSFSENILAKRIYVINDLIEVVNTNEVPQYTSIDRPCYQVRIEESIKKGYIKLLQVQNNSEIIKKNNEYDENYEPLPGTSSRSESEYGYITDLRTPKQLINTAHNHSNYDNDNDDDDDDDDDDSNDRKPKRRDTLPESCFVYREIKYNPNENIETDEDDDEEAKLEYLENLDENDFLKTVVYISSREFMKYFQNNIFRCSLGKSLGFNDESVSLARAIPGKIFCDDINMLMKQAKLYEVIPAVSILWPRDQTIEFIRRDDRPTITDTRTGQRYRWPTDGPGEMIDEIITLTAALVPKGFHTKKGEKNIDSYIEWEINFPKAERYLEARMSHAQMKCYLILVTLHKAYIEPVTQQNGLLVEHIRTHMYWECERNYRNWPAHRLGIKLLLVIKNLQKKLYKCQMYDFFIKDRDLFENIPKGYLHFAQKVLLNILSNPIPYFICALRNIRYTNGKFYPPLDYGELYNMISTTQTAALVNPKLIPHEKIHYIKPKIFKDPEQQLAHLREIRKKEKILEERRKAEEALKKDDETLENTDNSSNFDLVVDKKMDLWQTQAILTFFIKHFIDIAGRSSILSTHEQALFYLKQAYYLTTILKNKSPSSIEDCIEFHKQISAEEKRIKRKSFRSGSLSSDTRPHTPTRNNSSFKFDQVPHHIKMESMQLNNNSHNSGNIESLPTSNGFITPRGKIIKPALQKNNSFTQSFGGVPKKRTVAFMS